MKKYRMICIACMAAGLVLAALGAPLVADEKMAEEDIMLEPPEFDDMGGFDAMAEIYREGLEAAERADLGPMTRRQGLEKAAQAIDLSGINIMPTRGVRVTEEMFQQGIEMRHGIIAVADRLLEGGKLDDGLAAFALDLAATQKAKIDTLMTLATWTRKYNPNSPKAKILARNIRAPFVPFAPFRTPQKEIRSGKIGEGECFIVLKEIQGVKAMLIPKLIPVWQEPWFQRRHIVGFKVVWRLQWLPAEWVKRLSTCKEDGKLRHDDHQKIIHEPLLLEMWRFYGMHPH